MKTQFTATTLAATLLASATLLHAADIFVDDFTSEGTGAWFRAGVPGTLANTGGALVWNENGNSMDEAIGRSFPEQTLSVGQTIRLTFDYSQSADVTNNIIRAGLYDVTTAVANNAWSTDKKIGAWQGYSTFVRDASGSGNVAREDFGDNTSFQFGPAGGLSNASNPTVSQTTITSPANTAIFDINDDGTVTYRVVFEVTRTESGMNTLLTLSSGGSLHFSVTGTTSTVYSTFDTVVLRQTGGPSTNATYDNIQVSIIGGGMSGYALWSSTNAPTTDPDEDEDGDGVSSAIEYVLGGTISSNDLAKLPTPSTSGGNLSFTFERDQDSVDGSTAVVIEVGTTLETWPETYTVGADTAASTAGVTIVKDSPVAGTDTVTLTIPQAPDAQKFARLKVTTP